MMVVFGEGQAAISWVKILLDVVLALLVAACFGLTAYGCWLSLIT